MLHIRTNHRCSIERRQHTGVTLTQEVVAATFTRHIHLRLNGLTKLFNIEFALFIEALREILLQALHFTSDRRNRLVIFCDLLNHIIVFQIRFKSTIFKISGKDTKKFPNMKTFLLKITQLFMTAARGSAAARHLESA